MIVQASVMELPESAGASLPDEDLPSKALRQFGVVSFWHARLCQRSFTGVHCVSFSRRWSLPLSAVLGDGSSRHRVSTRDS